MVYARGVINESEGRLSVMIPTRTERLIAAAAAAAAVVTLMALAALHVLSPEFDPAWRMVSEYALGQYSSILSIMFGCWALSSWALTAAVWRRATGVIARTGALLLALAGMGEVMAAWFDVLHPLHGLAALLGVPSLPVAAAILTFSHSGRAALGGPNAALSISAHLTWVAFVTLAIAMFVLMTTFQEAGGDMSASQSPRVLPAGVIAFNGWANRLLVFAYCCWMAIAALRIARARP